MPAIAKTIRTDALSLGLMANSVTIPDSLLPLDGRFGSGPSKIRLEQMKALNDAGTTIMGTSHRQPPVKQLVASIRTGLRDFFALPDGYEVVLGNGGASAFWDIVSSCLVEHRAACGTYGSFSASFAKAMATAPFLEDPALYDSAPGTYRLPEYTDGVDAYCWAHNETSTGVAAPVRRVPGSEAQHALTIIDATSGAGALPVDITQTDVYYFSPQKAFGSEGGLWIAILSPAAIERVNALQDDAGGKNSSRWIPRFLSLKTAIDNSRNNQTLNTPSIATLILLENQIRWLNAQGGLSWATQRCAHSADLLYTWAQHSGYTSPFVQSPDARSHAVVTLEVDQTIDANEIIAQLRANGIVDTFGYRKLGLNLLRVGVFPSVDPADVEALTHCIDYVTEHLQTAEPRR